MKQGNQPKSGWRKAWGGIHVVDKCLMIFMLVLLAQSAYSLFMHTGPAKGSDGIDIIVRTAAASIFGYFLSANFMGDSTQSSPQGVQAPRSTQTSLGYAAPQAGAQQPPMPRAQIGIAVPKAVGQTSQGNPPQGVPPPQPLPPPRAQSHFQSGSLQIIAAASIGLFCLLVLLIVRNGSIGASVTDASGAATATVAQFRDFVSGCVGFLIGTPTGKKQEKS